jgi:hypothetical protein
MNRWRIYRDNKRGHPPRRYHTRMPKGSNQFGGADANLARAAAIRAAWDDPLRRALMSRMKTRP